MEKATAFEAGNNGNQSNIDIENNNVNLKIDLKKLNEEYKQLSTLDRLKRFYKDFYRIFNGKASKIKEQIILTSSFGTTSAILLHLYYKAGVHQPVYFLDTTYHFKETIAYKEKLADLLKLSVIDLKPEQGKNDYTRTYQLWKSDPDMCCSINKVEPLDQIKQNAKCWVSGLMGWQNEFRKNLDVFQEKDGMIKFYPIIDMTEEEASEYLKINNLPEHPLKPLGYESVGCVHCTFKGKRRQGRWANLSKTECGLHN